MIENQPLHGRVHKVAERAQGVGNAYILGRESVTLLWALFFSFQAASVPTENNLKLATGGFGCFAWQIL